MENASKAILMAGGILIGIIILGALFLMFKNLSSYKSSDTNNSRTAQVLEFNNQYDTYDRKDVRGSELYSLLNKVIDYNRRKTDYAYGSTGSAKTENDEGAGLKYMPMTIKVDLNGKKADFSIDGTNVLIQNNSYTESDVDNDFKTKIDNKLKSMVGSYSSSVIQNLGSVASEIYGTLPRSGSSFKTSGFSEYELTTIRDAIIKYDSATGENLRYKTNNNSENIADVIKSSLNTLINANNLKKAYACHEFVQFKRARFSCEKMVTDPNTGRVTEMVFKFTGKFE